MAVYHDRRWFWFLGLLFLPFQAMAQSPDEEAMLAHMDTAFSWGKPMDVIASTGEVLPEEYLLQEAQGSREEGLDSELKMVGATRAALRWYNADDFWPWVCVMRAQTFSFICPWRGKQGP